jgi:Alginate export
MFALQLAAISGSLRSAFKPLLLLRCPLFYVQLSLRCVAPRHLQFATVLAAALVLSVSSARAQDPAGNKARSSDPYNPDSPAGSHASRDLRVSGPNSGAWLFPVTELDKSLPRWLQFGGQFRDRLEGQTGLHYAPADDLYNLTQFRLGMYMQPASWFKIVAVTQDSRVFFNQHVPNAQPYENVWDLREAYASFGSADSGWISATVGRQMLSFGDERVIGPSDWSNMGRTFDVARVDLHTSGFKASIFAASVIVARDGVIDHHIQGNNVYGLYTTLDKLIPHATLEPYLLWRVAPGRLALAENAGGFGPLNEVTGGARLAGTVGAIDYDIEMNKQTGSLGPKTIDAWAGHWNAGYVLGKTRTKPRLFAEYNYASGNKNPAGSTWGTHDEIFPSAHDKMDFADQFGWRNIKDLRVGLQEKLGRTWTLSQVVDNVWLATKYDAMYTSSGAISVRANPNVTSTHAGTELELIAEYRQSKHVTFGFGLAHLFTGAFLNQTTPGRDYNYPFAYSTYIF